MGPDGDTPSCPPSDVRKGRSVVVPAGMLGEQSLAPVATHRPAAMPPPRQPAAPAREPVLARGPVEVRLDGYTLSVGETVYYLTQGLNWNPQGKWRSMIEVGVEAEH